MAKEIYAKGPYARKFGNTVREVQVAGEALGDSRPFRDAVKDLWVWVKDYTVLENEVIELREELARLKNQAQAQVKEEEPKQGPRNAMVSPNEAGPWFDGSRGIYLPGMVITEAITHGATNLEDFRSLSPEEMLARDDYYEAMDDAETYMNTLAPPGYWFGSSEQGDWGLWEMDQEDSESEHPTPREPLADEPED